MNCHEATRQEPASEVLKIKCGEKVHSSCIAAKMGADRMCRHLHLIAHHRSAGYAQSSKAKFNYTRDVISTQSHARRYPVWKKDATCRVQFQKSSLSDEYS